MAVPRLSADGVCACWTLGPMYLATACPGCCWWASAARPAPAAHGQARFLCCGWVQPRVHRPGLIAVIADRQLQTMLLRLQGRWLRT
jgi:hypothetical protein